MNNVLQKHLKLFEIPCLPLPEMYKETMKHLAVEGLWLECGVYKGDSARNILDCDTSGQKILYGFDSFLGMEENLTPRNHKGICALSEIPEYPSNLKLIKGLVQDTLIDFLDEHINEPIAFVNLDMTYTPVFYVLETLAKYNKLKPGTIVSIQQAILAEKDKIYAGNYQAFIDVAKKYNLLFKHLVTSDVHLSLQFI